MRPWQLIRWGLGTTFAAIVVAACTTDTAPSGLRRTPAGSGPTVRFDLFATPLPEIPLPNDVGTWPDPTSRTGLRINASLIAPTSIERDARQKLSELEGWGTFAPISVAFDRAGDLADGEAAIDLANIKKRHQRDNFDFANDAVYLVNLKTGVPVPIDLGEGSFNPTLRNLDRYWRNDPRSTEGNVLFETVDEAKLANKPKGTKYAPELDTDFDGVLDRPNLDDPDACKTTAQVAGDPAATLERDRCIADHLMTWYERETDTLVVRPVIPLDEMTEYAVVVTDRVVDSKGRAARSPLDFVYHPTQERGISRLRAILDDGGREKYFDDLSGTGLDHVAFAWTFTTEPTVSDMVALRDGLYGQGPFARIGDQFPAKLQLSRATGKLYQSDIEGGAEEPTIDQLSQQYTECKDKVPDIFLIKVDTIKDMLVQIVEQVFDLHGPEEAALLASWDQIDYFALGKFQSPFFVQGGPKGTDPHASFHVNFSTGDGDVDSDTVQFWMAVPKKTAQHKAPFPVNIYGHGYTGNSTEMFLYAGTMARLGMATIGINAVGHGLDIDAGTEKLAKALFKGACLAPAGDAFVSGRARDLNGDGHADSGGDFWTSYMFHTRDVVRQSTLDHIQLTRILRSFDGKTVSDQDYNNDGKIDLAGDFDGDGTPDLGGPTVPIGTWGQSLGAFLSAIHGAVDHNVDSAAPTSGGAMTDVATRTFQGGVVEAVILRNFGPLVTSTPASDFYAANGKADPKQTACTKDQISMRWVIPDLNGTADLEFACVDASKMPANGATVVVYNADNGKARCARVGDNGKFRIGIPTSTGDRIEVDVWNHADWVDSYGTCNPKSPTPDTQIVAWGKGPIPNGAPDPDPGKPGVIDCPDSASCTRYQNLFFGEGSPLIAPGDGYGFFRQSPDLRRLLGLAQMILDPADAISFMPYYGLKTLPDPSGKTMKPHGLMDIQTIGDMNVPLSAGIEYGRAAGALPFFTPEQAAKYPEYADYATPTALYTDLGGVTPNRFLIDSHVIEGINRLKRHPADATCTRNQKPNDPTNPDNAICHPKGCKSNGNPCLGDQYCDEATDTCLAAVDKETCEETLFDPDVLAEGKQLFGAQSANKPLRLARLAQHATQEDMNAVWAPRLLGKPYTGTDGAWKPQDGVPLVSILDAMVEPKGTHTFTNPSPCKNFDESLYLGLVVAQFFDTRGQDLYYLSHPKTHQCLEQLSCPELWPAGGGGQ